MIVIHVDTVTKRPIDENNKYHATGSINLFVKGFLPDLLLPECWGWRRGGSITLKS